VLIGPTREDVCNGGNWAGRKARMLEGEMWGEEEDGRGDAVNGLFYSWKRWGVTEGQSWKHWGMWVVGEGGEGRVI